MNATQMMEAPLMTYLAVSCFSHSLLTEFSRRVESKRRVFEQELSSNEGGGWEPRPLSHLLDYAWHQTHTQQIAVYNETMKHVNYLYIRHNHIYIRIDYNHYIQEEVSQCFEKQGYSIYLANQTPPFPSPHLHNRCIITG